MVMQKKATTNLSSVVENAGQLEPLFKSVSKKVRGVVNLMESVEDNHVYC